MDLGLQGKCAIITGASRGLGRELALAFAREGAHLAICARDRDALAATAEEIRSLGVRCVTTTADLFEASDCIRVVEEAAEGLGRLDVLVNNASTSVDKTPRSLEQASDGQILERLMGKTMAAIRCARAAIPHLRRAGTGRIICIGGTSARSVFRPGELPAGGSSIPTGLGNAALANFAKQLSEEVASDGILVNIVHPHVTRTSRHPNRVARRARELGVSEKEAEASIAAEFPIGRVVEPSDIAPLVLFLASALAGAITGQSVAVDGGAVRTVMY
jgi:3-oxoacyl-[acyl-carrier protein] reductase